MEYIDSLMLIEQEDEKNIYFNVQSLKSYQVEIQKKICKKKYQKALKWTHLPSPFSESQVHSKFLLYGNINLFTNYKKDGNINSPYISECIIENGHYKLDKITVQYEKGIEIHVSQVKPCLDRLQFLINLFKRYQSNIYTELASSLLQYQKHIKQETTRSNQMYKQFKKDSSLQLRLQEEFYNFEKKAVNDIHSKFQQTNSNSFYSYQTILMNYKTSQPEIKKIGTSESLINLLGNTMKDEYQHLLLKIRKQQTFNKNQENNLFKNKESIDKCTFLIKKIVEEIQSFTYSETLLTRDGIEIPCTIQVEIIQNNSLNQTSYYEPSDQHIILYTYSFDKNDIQTLQNIREKSQLIQTVSPQQTNINFTLDNIEESQEMYNDNISDTLSYQSQINFNNQQTQYNNQQIQYNNSNQNTPLFSAKNQLINKFAISPKFSPLSQASLPTQCSSSYDINVRQSIDYCKEDMSMIQQQDYTKQSDLFIKKYYNHLLKK